MNYSSNKVLWVTRTAVFTALLITFQALTALTQVTLFTGSVVNMMLILSVMTCGLSSGVCVAVISPVAAKLLGIGPLWELIPFIILGNITIVSLWHVIGNRSFGYKYFPYATALVSGALGKFLVLHISIARIAVPLLLKLPPQQAETVSALFFSVHQLITATAGGAAAFLILPKLKKAIAKSS